MNCRSCNDIGIFKVAYRDGSPTEYAVCLCEAGERMRKADNCGKACIPQWGLWAHRNGIDPGLVAPMEDLLTPDELRARGFAELTPTTAIDAIAAAARGRDVKR